MEHELYHWGIKKGEAAENHKYTRREWKNNRWVYYYDTPGAANKSAAQQPNVERKSVTKPAVKKPLKKPLDTSQAVSKGSSTVKNILSNPVKTFNSKNIEVVKQRFPDVKQLVESRTSNKKDVAISGSVTRVEPSNPVKKEVNDPIKKEVKKEIKKPLKKDIIDPVNKETNDLTENPLMNPVRNKNAKVDTKVDTKTDAKTDAKTDKDDSVQSRLEKRRAEVAKQQAERDAQKAREEQAKKEYEDSQNAERNGIRKNELEQALALLNKPSTWFKKYNPLPELDKKKDATTLDEDMAAINPKINSDDKSRYDENCAVCTLAYDLRRRGYDVMASSEEVTFTKKHPGGGLTLSEIQACYKGGEFVTMGDISNDNKNKGVSGEIKSALSNGDGTTLGNYMNKELLSHGEGARGHAVFVWTNGGAHDIVWEVENGKVVYRDCQTNKKIKLEEYSSVSKDMYYMRTDNLQLTDEAMKYVRNRKDGQ